jgi:nucleotide-binding universal stress UspA family protein
MKKILIALDYTNVAQKVAEDGYALAKAMNAQIVLLNVVEDAALSSSASYDSIMGFAGFENTDFSSEDALDSIEKEAAYFLENARRHVQDDNIATFVVRGDVAQSILETAKMEKCQLIVIGTHSKNDLAEPSLGSLAPKLLTHSPLPVYVVPLCNQTELIQPNISKK